MQIKLKRLSQSAYTSADEFFRSNDVKQISRDYWNYVYTSALDYLDTGDVNVLNRVVMASRFMTRVRVTRQLLSLVACHTQDKGKYKGKANTKRLKMVRAKQGDLKGKMEAIINRDLDLKAEQSNKPFDPDQAQTRAVRAIAELLAHDVSVDVSELYKLAIQERNKKASVRPSPLVATPEEL